MADTNTIPQRQIRRERRSVDSLAKNQRHHWATPSHFSTMGAADRPQLAAFPVHPHRVKLEKRKRIIKTKNNVIYFE